MTGSSLIVAHMQGTSSLSVRAADCWDSIAHDTDGHYVQCAFLWLLVHPSYSLAKHDISIIICLSILQ